MFKLADRVKEVSTTIGDGLYLSFYETFNGFRSFRDAIGDGNTTYYAIENGINFEIGIGSYVESTNSLSRDEILVSSNNNNRILLDGVSIVFCTYPASKAFLLNPSGLATTIDTPYIGIEFPDGTIKNTAREVREIQSINSDTLLQNTADVILVDCSISDITITLPSAANFNGKTITIKIINGPYKLTLNTLNNEMLDNVSSKIFPYQNTAISIISNQFNWFII